MAFPVLCKDLRITEGFGKGKTRELGAGCGQEVTVAQKQKRARLEAEEGLG